MPDPRYLIEKMMARLEEQPEFATLGLKTDNMQIQFTPEPKGLHPENFPMVVFHYQTVDNEEFADIENGELYVIVASKRYNVVNPVSNFIHETLNGFRFADDTMNLYYCNATKGRTTPVHEGKNNYWESVPTFKVKFG